MSEEPAGQGYSSKHPWVTSSDKVVHPDAPRGGGGRGKFRPASGLGVNEDLVPAAPHPGSPAARRLFVTNECKASALDKKKGKVKKDQPPKKKKAAVAVQKKMPKVPVVKPPETKPAVFDVEGAKVHVLADNRNDNSVNVGSAKTEINFGVTAPAGEPGADGQTISKLVGAPASITVTLQICYHPTANPIQPSWYGRGTTQADIDQGTTTLGFHESCHLEDYISYLYAHDLPKFGGKVGMTKAQYEKAGETFLAAIAKYRAAINAHTEKLTHEVGYTTAAFNAAKGDRKLLSGNWMVLSYHTNGAKGKAPMNRWRFDNGLVVWLHGKKSIGDFEYGQLASDKKPKTMVLLDGKRQLWKGIYKFVDKQLTICISDVGLPKAFSTRAGYNEHLYTLKKVT